MSMVPGGLPSAPHTLALGLGPRRPLSNSPRSPGGESAQRAGSQRMQESQASLFFLGLGRTTTPSSLWGTHLLGLARASRAVGSWSLNPFTGAEGWEDEALERSLEWPYLAGGLWVGAVLCGPRGYWEFLFFCFVFQMRRDHLQFNIPGWRRTAEGGPPSGVPLAHSPQRD